MMTASFAKVAALSSVFLLAACSNQAPPTPGCSNPAVEISMGKDTYTPSDATIKKGECVRFTNESGVDRWPASNIHPDHSVYPEFDPKKAVPAGSSWSFIFEKVGQWRLHDHLAPQITGVIRVEN